MDAPLLERVRRDGERLCEALARERYETAAARKETSNLSGIHDRFGWLSEPTTFQEVRELREREGEGPAREGLGRLAEWLASMIESAAGRTLADERVAEEARATVTVRGEIVRALDLPGRIRNTADRMMRSELAQAQEAAWLEQAPLAADVLAVGREAVVALGLGSYVKAKSVLSGVDLVALARQAEDFLTRTDDLYREAMGDTVRRALNLPLARAELHDLWFCFRLRAHDVRFPPGDLVPRVLEFQRRMGLDPMAAGRIRHDLEDRPGKTSRAFCAAIRVPDEIVLVVRPSGGVDDYRAFLHESGHALHFANVDRGLAFEDRLLGDASVTEAHAFTMDRLATDRVWLRKVMRHDRRESELPAREVATHDLFVARRQAAKLCYDLLLHDGASDLPGRYVDLLRRASGVAVSSARHMADVDPDFYAGRYLRGWMLEATLSEVLRDRYDEDWFVNPRAGAFLQGLYAAGQRQDAAQLAAAVGGQLEVDAMIRRFEEVLA